MNFNKKRKKKETIWWCLHCGITFQGKLYDPMKPDEEGLEWCSCGAATPIDYIPYKAGAWVQWGKEAGWPERPRLNTVYEY